jgi:nickel superoxide dismutase
MKETLVLSRLFSSATVAHAHCDLFCGVYDPAQAKIEAMSVLKAAKKYQDSDDPVFRDRAILIKEERAELVKHHVMVLWADFFTPEHVEQFPQLHDLVWRTIRQAGDAKKSVDPSDGEKLVALIDEIADIFWQTAKAKDAGVYPPS